MKYTIIRRAFSGLQGRKIQTVSAGTAHKRLISATALARAIARTGSLPPEVESSDQDLDDEYQSWIDYGWQRSLPFYLSTLDRTYQDTQDNYQTVQHHVLQTYAKQGALPLEQYLDGVWHPLPHIPSERPPLSQTIRNRRTTLVPSSSALSIEVLSSILESGSAKLATFRALDNQADPRNALVNFGPSLDIYVACYKVDGIDPGIYRYHITEHALISLPHQFNFSREAMRQALVGQPAPMTAAVSVIYVSDVSRHQWRYRHSRALRGLWIDTAKTVNELLWALARRRIVPHITPALDDTRICALLGEPDDLSKIPVYAISFGGPK
ncbi:hypothetical protein NSA19_09875 [Actinomyces bowdenii]|uniref:hypothetical protein n=1 Tax=Actinomyces bowdenii TaxID=131109 RepID=UPI00214D0E45|nr:hypothetical protein [Actinomyces bowdenii]MCR2053141.1 hypothetical protein [Actinomyces bowdenii]